MRADGSLVRDAGNPVFADSDPASDENRQVSHYGCGSITCNPGDAMSRRTEAEEACRAREPQYRFRARELGSTHLITPDETNPPLRGELPRGGRAGRGLGEPEDQAGLEPRGVRADRVLVELVDRVDLVGAAVELLRD